MRCWWPKYSLFFLHNELCKPFYLKVVDVSNIAYNTYCLSHYQTKDFMPNMAQDGKAAGATYSQHDQSWTLKIQTYWNRLYILFINRNIQSCWDAAESQIRIFTCSGVSYLPMAASSRSKYVHKRKYPGSPQGLAYPNRCPGMNNRANIHE